MMDTKAAFEKWCINQCNYTLTKGTARNYLSLRTRMAYIVWQASRAEIEIELPYNDLISDATDEQWDKAVDACSEAITSHGIRIKGAE